MSNVTKYVWATGAFETYQMQKVLTLRSDAMAHWQIGEILVRMGRVKSAVTSYNSAIKLKPELAQSANNLAWILATCENVKLRNANDAISLTQTAEGALQESTN